MSREQRLELAPAVELHREMPVARLLGQEARSDDDVVLGGAVAPDEVEQDRQEMDDGADDRHHREQHVPARLRHAHELGHASLGVVEHVAERAAEANGRVEARVLPPRQIPHVGHDTLADPLLEAGGREALDVQLELAWRYVGDDDLRAQPSQLDREAPGPSADVEHSVARTDEPAEMIDVDVQARRRGSSVLEMRALLITAIVVVGLDKSGVAIHPACLVYVQLALALL